MLTHKAFMICWDVFCGKDVTIHKKVPVHIIELVHNGLVRFENRGTKIAVLGTAKLCNTFKALHAKQIPHKNLLTKNHECKALQSESLHSETVNDSCQLETVGPLIARSVKHSNPAYRAVVDGKQPRRDPMIEYTKRMSPIDVADFWEAYGKLSDDEQTAYRRSFASAASRG
tara:strand:+ start:98 stop:613 length:516 start_codon:yes stop_codon:yes gene_type:complete